MLKMGIEAICLSLDLYVYIYIYVTSPFYHDTNTSCIF